MDVDRLIKKKKRIQRDGNIKQLAGIVKELGDMYFETGKYENALQEYIEQLEICNILEDKLNIAVAHRMVGEMHANLGNYEEALKHQNNYLERAKEIKNSLEQQRAYATLGRTYFCFAESLSEKSDKRSNALTSARKAYMKSIRLCNDIGETDVDFKELMTMRARLLLNLGLVMEAQREHQEAVDLMEKAAGMCETHNLQEDFHRTQIALGGIYERKCEYDLALKHFETASEVDNAFLKAEAKLFQAELLLKIERWQESRKILVSLYVMSNLPGNLKDQVEKGLRIVATLHSTEEALTTEKSAHGKLKLYETLGDAAVAARCFNKAVEYYKKMLICAEEIKSDRTGAALLSLAQTLKDVRRYNDALEFARKELELCTDPREICRSALFLAELLIAINPRDETIEETYDLALKNAKICDDVSLELSVLQERLNFLNSINDCDSNDEKEVLKAKIDALEKLCNDTDSENESEENNVGGNICLDDLSDVEAELKMKDNIRNRKRARKKSVVVKRNEKGETLLHVACINGNIESVEKLLESGHATNVRDNFGWTPLHEAANHGYIEVAKLLLKHDADVNDSGSLMCQGVTPLHDAASCGNISMMRLLMEHGANVQLKTNDDDTVLDCLIQWRDRVDHLSHKDQADYDEMYNLLSSMISSKKKNVKRQCKSPFKSKTHQAAETDERDKVSAGEDYKRTIASLKHRSDPIGTSLSRTSRSVKPLLNSEEVLLEDWLEDDINEGFADEKYSDEHSTSMTKRKSNSDDSGTDKNVKRHKTNDYSPVNKDKELIANENSNDSCDSEIGHRSNEWSFRKKKRQPSLLSIGFTKNNVSRTPSPIPTSPTKFEPKEIDITKSVILNISVDGKVFKTQVEFSKAMKPMVQEILTDIEIKFYNDTGCRVKLELKTMNGIVVNNNNVFTILNEGDIVKKFTCEVLELQTPSIVERYRTICENCNIGVRESITKCLKSCENTYVVRLKQEDIKKGELVSFLKALEYQKNVQILDISGHEMHEIGQIFNDTILRLSTLQELYLERCDIDYNCLTKLEKLPSQLRLLDLSYNPLGPTSEQILSKLLNPLTQLRTLCLRYCQLRNIQCLLNNNNNSLANLDVSWNNFEEDGACTALQRRLLNLNLSSTTCSSEINLVRNIFDKSNFSFANMESLELSSCDLTDVDVENILSHVSTLSKLVLRGNRKIGTKSLNSLLRYTPTFRHIDVGGCTNIAEFPDSEVFIERPEICTLIVSMCPEVCDCWLKLWRGVGVVQKFPHNFTIFQPLMKLVN